MLTPDDIRILIEMIDENNRKGNFERIFPAVDTHQYLQYFDQPRYYSLLLSQWVNKFPDANPQGYCSSNMFREHFLPHNQLPCSQGSRMRTTVSVSMQIAVALSIEPGV